MATHKKQKKQKKTTGRTTLIEGTVPRRPRTRAAKRAAKRAGISMEGGQ